MTTVSAWLLDCNGVVFVEDELLPGVAEAIERVRDRDIPVRFVTNHPRRSRRTMASHLTELGVPATDSEIVTSTWATANYLDDHDLRSAFVVGSSGLHDELDEIGIRETTTNPDAVVVGVTPGVTYADLAVATRLLLEENTAFVATNPDTTYPTVDGPSPGTGALVAFLERASERTATIVGKPEGPMFEYALATLPTIERDEVVFVGDTIETDVVGAHRAGLRAAYVGEPSVTTEGESTPDAVADSLPSVLDGHVDIPR